MVEQRDEPGLPAMDEEKAALMVRLIRATLYAETADVRGGLGAILREISQDDPGALERLATALQLRGVSPGRSTAH